MAEVSQLIMRITGARDTGQSPRKVSPFALRRRMCQNLGGLAFRLQVCDVGGSAGE